MSRRFALAAVLFVSCSLHAQINPDCSQQKILGILGHSQARTMYTWLVQNPTQLPCFPVSRIVVVNQDSATCNQLLQFLPYYLNLIIIPKNPAYLILWVGGPDAEQMVTTNGFTSCVNTLIQTTTTILQTAGLSTELVWPSINIDSSAAENGNQSYLTLVESYNDALPAILSQYPNVIPVDVTTPTTLSDGWGNPAYEYIDFYPLGWQVVMPNFRTVLQ